MPTKVKIEKASVDSLWYVEHIGETFEVEISKNLLFEYEIKDEYGIRYIAYNDAFII